MHIQTPAKIKNNPNIFFLEIFSFNIILLKMAIKKKPVDSSIGANDNGTTFSEYTDINVQEKNKI